MKNCVFIGGKQIGVNCLKYLLKKRIYPNVVVPNTDDLRGDKLWHDSLTKLSIDMGLETIPLVVAHDRIKNINPEIIFCIGSVHMISPEILSIPKLGTVNIHPALLPKYRGRYSTMWVIFDGEKETGVTSHWMNNDMDAGNIIFQEKIPIDESDTARSLYDKFTVEGTKMFERIVDHWISDKELPSIPQDHSKATYCKKELPNGGVIDWSWDGNKIRQFIRAMTFPPFQSPNFMIGDKKYEIIT